MRQVVFLLPALMGSVIATERRLDKIIALFYLTLLTNILLGFSDNAIIHI